MFPLLAPAEKPLPRSIKSPWQRNAIPMLCSAAIKSSHTTTPLLFHVLHAKPHNTIATPTLAAHPQAQPVKQADPLHCVLSGSLPAL